MEFTRLRRLRGKKFLRELLRENTLSVSDFILPIFVVPGKGRKEEIPSMPGIYRFSIDNLNREVEEAEKLGIPAVLIFGVPESKDESGSPAYHREGIVQKAVQEIKKEFPHMGVITDVCLCSYTRHGHCGIIRYGRKETTSFEIDNDKTLKVLGKIALSQAEVGADMVAPSAMVDGQVKAIREVLDENGYRDTGIMSYSAKYASSFYGPFREAADSSPRFGDRRSYQMDYHNREEALREVEADIEEGADIVMVKPALSYLDVIREAKEAFNFPLAAYSVSGEYSMVKAAAQKGWIEERKAVLEILTSIKRAGADIIITYWAKGAAKWIGG
ncbi:MAG: porphobilinogen synthase [Caldiserica bacterium]|nr:porphobilinogen synthase [Caldisericota bacterium]